MVFFYRLVGPVHFLSIRDLVSYSRHVHVSMNYGVLGLSINSIYFYSVVLCSGWLVRRIRRLSFIYVILYS